MGDGYVRLGARWTLSASGFESGVYVRHGSLSNIFTNLEDGPMPGVEQKHQVNLFLCIINYILW